MQSGPDAYGGIPNSGAITLELYANSSATGLYLDGNVGGGSQSTGPVSLISGHAIDVTITFNGTLLKTSMFDTVTGQTFNPAPYVATDLLASLGGSTALIGFTASTTGNQTADQYFSNVRFKPIPAPAGLSGLVFGAAAVVRRRR